MKLVQFVLQPLEEQFRIVAWTAGIVFLGVLTVAPTGARASAGVASLDRLRLPPGASYEMLAERLWLHGVPAQVLVFDVPQSPAALARGLSAQQPALKDLHVLPGQLILSGRVGEDRWVAQMERAGAGRTVGSISAVSVRAAPTAPRPTWLPDGARVRMDVAVTEAGAKVSERIWQHALPPEKMAGLLETGLRQAGWKQEPPADTGQADGLRIGAGQWWTRERERMKLWLVPMETGSGLRAIGWAP
ncbi:hypothetical protein [Achromobacter sp.]|uniref:hypothetical protein n=1 Tax=Achromobacter sp. TaxID=134375 RepID=UPI0028AC1984|nr:hypothetical protein [Achromobacter sp.]